MIVYTALIIPIIITFVAYYLYRKNFVWWELILPFVVTALAIFVAKLCVEQAEITSTEYLTVPIKCAQYYERWDEKVSCRHPIYCSRLRMDSKGHLRSESYVCGHHHPFDVDIHDPYYMIVTENDKSENISKEQYDYYEKLYNNKQYVQMNHPYYSINGNMWQTNWDKSDAKREPYFYSEWYTNKIKASDIHKFNMSPVEDSIIKKYHLIDYPSLKNKYDFPTLLGLNVNPKIQKEFEKLNAKFGPSNQLHLWILVFENPDLIVGKYQENYWIRGNKNELTLCIGIDSVKNIQWTHVFSWSKSEQLKSDIKDYSFSLSNLNDTSLIKLRVFLDQHLGEYKRRSFKEFDYLTVEPTTWSIIVIYLLALIVSVGVNIWNIKNDFED